MTKLENMNFQHIKHIWSHNIVWYNIESIARQEKKAKIEILNTQTICLKKRTNKKHCEEEPKEVRGKPGDWGINQS